MQVLQQYSIGTQTFLWCSWACWRIDCSCWMLDGSKYNSGEAEYVWDQFWKMWFLTPLMKTEGWPFTGNIFNIFLMENFSETLIYETNCQFYFLLVNVAWVDTVSLLRGDRRTLSSIIKHMYLIPTPIECCTIKVYVKSR